MTEAQSLRLTKVHARTAEVYIDGALQWAATQPGLMEALRGAEARLDEASEDKFDEALDDLQMALVDIVQSYRNSRPR